MEHLLSVNDTVMDQVLNIYRPTKRRLPNNSFIQAPTNVF